MLIQLANALSIKSEHISCCFLIPRKTFISGITGKLCVSSASTYRKHRSKMNIQAYGPEVLAFSCSIIIYNFHHGHLASFMPKIGKNMLNHTLIIQFYCLALLVPHSFSLNLLLYAKSNLKFPCNG